MFDTPYANCRATPLLPTIAQRNRSVCFPLNDGTPRWHSVIFINCYHVLRYSAIWQSCIDNDRSETMKYYAAGHLKRSSRSPRLTRWQRVTQKNRVDGMKFAKASSSNIFSAPRVGAKNADHKRQNSQTPGQFLSAVWIVVRHAT